VEAGGGPGLPAKPWKKASPFGIGQSQVPPGAWALAEQSHQVPQPSSPGGWGVGEGHRQEVIERLRPLPAQLLPSAIALISEKLTGM